MKECDKQNSHISSKLHIIAQHSLCSCLLCCFLKAANNMCSVRWQCTVSSLISNVCSLFFFLFFCLFIVVLLLRCMKYVNWKVGYPAPTLLLLYRI